MRSTAVSALTRLSLRRLHLAAAPWLLFSLACGETSDDPSPVDPSTSSSTNPPVTPSSGPPTVTPTPTSNVPVTPSSSTPTNVNPPVEPNPTSVPTDTPTQVQPTSAPTSPTSDTSPTPVTGDPSTDDVTSEPTEPQNPTSICPPNPGTAPSGTLNATVIDVTRADPNAYTLFEGPVWVDGALYFSEINPNPWDSHIRKYVPGASDAEVFLSNAGSNGLAVDAQGVMYSATARKKEISKYDLANKTQSSAVTGNFNSPNDIAISSNGTIYFSDQQQGELPAGGQPQVVHIVKDGVDAVFHPDIQPPNGVTLSPDEDILYVAVTGNGLIKKVTLNADGTANTATDFATGLQTPDGMTVDCLGNLYVAEHNAQQVTVFSPDGTKIANIKTGQANNQSANTTNVAFGGADRKTLFITAAYSLWSIDLQVAGYPN
jgi:sugar lactone lactonase YvrE